MKKAVVLLAGMFIAGLTNAGTIEDSVSQDMEVDVTLQDYVAYAHDLDPHGFVRGSATSATLTVEIEQTKYTGEDCVDVYCNSDGLYSMFLNTSGDWDPVYGQIFSEGTFNADAGETGFVDIELSADSLAWLNTNAYIYVYLLSFGNFTLGDSVLTVHTRDATGGTASPPVTVTPPTSVTEPAAIALLGFGLLAMVFLRQHRAPE